MKKEMKNGQVVLLFAESEMMTQIGLLRERFPGDRILAIYRGEQPRLAEGCELVSVSNFEPSRDIMYVIIAPIDGDNARVMIEYTRMLIRLVQTAGVHVYLRTDRGLGSIALNRPPYPPPVRYAPV